MNEAHRLGLAVILDVVYNHFGPVGNFFAEFAPSVDGEPGEWGHSINYDGEGSQPVRDFMTENAAYWIREFHFDGLRLDAVHALLDRSKVHIVAELCRAAREAAGTVRYSSPVNASHRIRGCCVTPAPTQTASMPSGMKTGITRPSCD